MATNSVIFYNQVKRVWEEIARTGESAPLNFQLEMHKKLLSIFQPGEFYYFIFNVRKGEFEFVSDQIKKVLGYEAGSMNASQFLNNIHPQDQPYFIRFEKQLSVFYRNLPIEQITNYKVQYDFRIKDAQGLYRRMLHQLAIIEHDDDKNLLRSLGVHTDISHIKPDGIPQLSFIGMGDEPSFHNVQVNQLELLPARELFTKREKEVVRLVLSGNNTAEIAALLNLSLHTINSHRKNVLRKSGCRSWLEFSRKAIKDSWI